MVDLFCSQVSISVEEASYFFCNSAEVNSTAMTRMVNPPLEEPENVNHGYYMPAADANTQTTDEDFIMLEPTREESTQTTDEDFILLEPTRDASIQTTEEDFILLEPTRDASTQTTEEDLIFHEPTREVSTQTADKDFIQLEATRDVSIQTTDEDFILPEPNSDVSTQSTKEVIILLDPTRDAGTRATDEDFILPEPNSDVSSQATKEVIILLDPTQDAGTRATDEDFILLESIQETITESSEGYFSSIESTENNSISTSERSADTSRHRYDNGCCIVNSNLSNFSSSLEVVINFGIANEYRNHSIPNDIQTANKVHVRTINMNAPKGPNPKRQGIRYNFRVHKISATSGQAISTKSAQGGTDNKFAMVSQMDFDNNCLAGVHKESLNSVKGSVEMQIFDDFNRNSKLLPISHFEDVASNMTISHSTQNENTRKISDFKLSAKSMCSAVDLSAVPGPSGYRDNMKTSNKCGKKFPPKCPSVRSVLSERKKRSICWICNTAFTEHDVVNNFYKCCVCRYTSYTKRDLQLHTNIHGPEPFSCKICGEGFKEKGSHGSEQTCNLCFKEFQCNSLLEKHSLVHEDYYSSHCRVCRWKINAHIIEHLRKKLYKCCGCSFGTSHKNYLLEHLRTHAGLRLFRCDECGKKFTQKEHLERHFQNHISRMNVNICRATYARSGFLDKHHIEKDSRA